MDLAASDGFVYIAEQYGDPGFGGHPRLRVVDATDPTQSVALGFVDVGGTSPADVVAWKQYAYMVVVGLGTGIIDARQPTAPVWVRWLVSGFVGYQDLAVRPETAPGAGDARLVHVVGPTTRLYDLSQPGNPVLIGSVPQGGEQVALAGDYAYVARPIWPSQAVVHVIRVVGPGAPSWVTSLTVPVPVGWMYGLSAEGDFLCMVGGGNSFDGVWVFDISDPGTISYVTRLDTFSASSVAMLDGKTYVGGLGVSQISLSGPGGPAIEGTFEGSSRAIFPVGDLLYTLGQAGLKIVDISNPSFVPLVGSLNVSSSKGLAVEGGTAFATASAALTSIDVSDPTTPLLLATLPAAHGALAVDGSYAYAADSSLSIVDVSDPSAMQVVASIPVSHPSANEIAVGNGLACIAVGTGVEIVDVSDPPAPVIVGSVAVPGGARSVALGDGVAVVTNATGIAVIDLTPPSSAQVVGTLPMSGARHVSVQGMLACVTGEDHFRLIDISIPSVPEILSEMAIGTYYARNTLDGGLAYVTENNGVLAVDISDPRAPFTVGLARTPSDPGRMAVANGHLFVSSDHLLIYPLHCPTVTHVEPSTAPPSLTLRIVPNPTAGPVRMELPPGAGPTTMSIYDVQGRLVQHWTGSALGAGRRAVTWDGRDGAGRQVPVGVYWVRLEDSRSREAAKITVVR